MSVRAGRVLGVPVEIHPTCIIAIVILSLSIGLGFVAKVHEDIPPAGAIIIGFAAACLLFACLVFHELAHVLAARRCGIGTHSISLFIFGGAADLARDPHEWRHELYIALAGPAASMLLATGWLGLYYYAFTPGSMLSTALFYLAFANALLGVANLAPGYPMDGGRAMKAAVWGLTGSRTLSSRITTALGEAIGAGAAAYGILLLLQRQPAGLWLIGVGWFLTDAAAQSWEQEKVHRMLEHSRAGEIVTNGALMDCVGLSVDNSESLAVHCKGAMLVDHRSIVGADENAWDVVERVGEMNADAAVVVCDDHDVLGVVEKRALPSLLMSRLSAAR